MSATDSGTWFVVKGRSEPGERLTDWHQKAEHEESIREFHPKLSYHRLVGAPIKQLSDFPTASCNVSQDSEIKNKIGGGLYLASHGAPISSPATTTPCHLSEFNLADAEEWPCMGLEDVLVPQLGSWSTVVKTAAPMPVHHSKSQVSYVFFTLRAAISLSCYFQELQSGEKIFLANDEEKVSNRTKKKKKHKESAIERTPLVLELASVFQTLEVIVGYLVLSWHDDCSYNNHSLNSRRRLWLPQVEVWHSISNLECWAAAIKVNSLEVAMPWILVLPLLEEERKGKHPRRKDPVLYAKYMLYS